MKNRTKISIIGAGNVGATLAQFLAIRRLGDIYLFDVMDGIPEGKSLDIQESGPLWGYDSRVRGFTTSESAVYSNMVDSDVIVVTAGFPRRPGMTRTDLLETNLRIISSVGRDIRMYSPDSIVIVVSNPADVMAYALKKITNIPYPRIIGLGGALDGARFRMFISNEVGVSVEDVTAFVIGGHGDEMIPFVRYTSVGGIPITELVDKPKLEEIIDRTRFGGGEIVALLKSGGAYFAPAISITSMVESIIKDKKRIISCATYLTGSTSIHYGAGDIFIGLPVIIGRNGVERTILINFTAQEKVLWSKTVEAVKFSCAKVDELLSKM